MYITTEYSVNTCKCKKHDIIKFSSNNIQNINKIVTINGVKILKISIKNNIITANIPVNSIQKGLDGLRIGFVVENKGLYANVASGYSAKSFPYQIVEMNPWGRMQTTPMVGR